MHVLSVTLTQFVLKVMETTLVPASLGMQAAARFVKVRFKPILFLLHFIERLIRPIYMSVNNRKVR